VASRRLESQAQATEGAPDLQIRGGRRCGWARQGCGCGLTRLGCGGLDREVRESLGHTVRPLCALHDGLRCCHFRGHRGAEAPVIKKGRHLIAAEGGGIGPDVWGVCGALAVGTALADGTRKVSACEDRGCGEALVVAGASSSICLRKVKKKRCVIMEEPGSIQSV
jgi:hypothetical protein